MLALLLGCALILGAPLAAQEPVSPDLTHPDPMRERLHALTEEQRSRLARNLEQLERLPPRTRAKLLERARVLRERERAFGRSKPQEPDARRQEQALQEASRLRRAWLREQGREVRARLPERVVRRLEQARPEVRRQYLERVIEQQERLGRRVLVKAQERSELPPHEVRRLERLPAREQIHALREFYRERGATAR